MTFGEILAQIVEPTPGAIAGAIMGADGIAVDEYRRDGATLDLDALVVEFQLVVEQARKVATSLYREGGSGLEELILRTGAHQILFRHIDAEYCIVVVLEPEGLLGKARYLARSLLGSIRAEL